MTLNITWLLMNAVNALCTADLNDKNELVNEFVTARKDGDVLLFNKEDVDLMDVGT